MSRLWMVATAALLVMAAAAAGEEVYPENGMMDIETPLLGLEEGDIEVSVDHRFLGDAFEDPFEDFFGADIGANVRLGARMILPSHLDLGLSYTRYGSVWGAAAGWSGAAGGLALRAQAGFYSQEVSVDERESGGMLEGSVEPVERFWRLQPVVSGGYDTRTETPGLALGADLLLGEAYSLWGEFMPVVGEEEETAENAAFSVGITVRTWGHQFMFGLGNSTGMGLRGTMVGMDDNDPRLRFRIRRLI
jgi:hypothetical protein